MDRVPTAAATSGGRPIPALSVVMPAYNEEAVLPVALEEAVGALEELCEDWEVVVVDDGSTDSTPEILRQWSEREPRLRVITQEVNQGYSKAVTRGLVSCRHDARFYTDADAQFDLREIALLYPRLAEAPMVTGFRVGRQDPPIRLLTSRVYNFLQGLALGLSVRDVNCAFKMFHRSYFEVVELRSDGFLIDAEMYARARRAGLRWVQVGVRHRPREQGSSTVRASTVTETLRELWRLRRALGRPERLPGPR